MSSPNVVVEMNADEKKVWSALDRLMKKEKEYQERIKQTGETSKSTQSEIEKAIHKANEAATGGAKEYARELKAIRSFAPDVAKEMERAFKATGTTGVQSMKDILASIGEVDASFAAVGKSAIASLEAADKSAKFEQTKQDLAALGGDFSVMAKEIEKSMAGSFEESVAEADKLVAKMKELDPSAAERIEAGMRNARKEIDDAKFETLQKQLSQSGDEGRELADVIGKDLKQASLDAEGGLDGVLQKIIQMRPETEASVRKYREANAEAAKFTEGKYAEVLETLRKGDPIAKQVAATLKRELVDAGEIVERSFEDMIAPLDKVDPKAAEAARRLKAEAEDAANTSEGHFARFGKSAIAQIWAVAGAYVGIQEAIQATNAMLLDQEALFRRAAERQMDLADVQQEARKNLISFSPEHQKQLLSDIPRQIASQTGFSDIKQLVRAAGAAGSAGGSFEQVVSAMTASAQLNRLTPHATDEFAAAAIDLGAATGIDDARVNLGFLLSALAQSRVTDPERGARNLAPAVRSSVQMVPGQDRAEAARDAAAMYGVFGKAATDVTGESTSTAVVQFNEKLGEFFRDLPNQIQEAQSKLENLKPGELSNVQQETLSRLLTKQDRFTPQAAAELKNLEERSRSGEELGKADRGRLSDLRSARFTRGDAARIADLEAKQNQNRAEFERDRERLLSQLERSRSISDPGTLGGRVVALQRNEALKQEFESERFGEARFRGAYRDILDPRSKVARDFIRSRNAIRVDAGLFDETATGLGKDTPELIIADFNERNEASRVAADLATERGTIGAIRKDAAKTLAETREDSVLGYVRSFFREGIGPASVGRRGLAGETAAEEGVDALRLFLDQRDDIEAGGVTAEERPRLNQLSDDIESMRRLLITQAPNLDRGSVLAAAESAERISRNAGIVYTQDGPFKVDASEREAFFDGIAEAFRKVLSEQNEMMREQVNASKQTAENTNPRNNRNLGGAPAVMGPNRGGRQ